MKKYVVGINLEGYKNIDISDNDTIKSIKESIVIVLLDSNSNNKLQAYYKGLKQLILNGNRPVLLMLNEESNIRKQLCMLMALYEKNDMYTVQSKNLLTQGYVEEMLKRSPTEEEIESYIGVEIRNYSKLNDILMELSKSVQDMDQAKALSTIANNILGIESSVQLIDDLRKITDDVSSGKIADKLKKLKSDTESMQNQIKVLKDNSDNLTRQLNEKIEAEGKLQKEVLTLKNSVEKDANSNGPTISIYDEIQTSLYKCKVKSIIYFKEVTYVRYVNSLVHYLMTFMKAGGLRVKLLIYDNKKALTEMYKEVYTVSASDYINHRADAFNQKEKVLVIEPHPAIIEDVIKSDYDVVIIYDRLKQAKDIVVGNCVYKYWVVNSRKEYDAINRDYKVNPEHVITRPDVVNNSIVLVTIHDYVDRTDGSKSQAYRSMANNKKIIFDSILSRTHVKALMEANRA